MSCNIDPILSRRAALARLGLTPWALRALACGLPTSFFAAHRAHGRVPGTAELESTAAATTPQFLVISTSMDGDPVGNNIPGTYPAAVGGPLSDIVHPPDAACAVKMLAQAGTQRPAAPR